MLRKKAKATLVIQEGEEEGTLDVRLKVRPKRKAGEVPYAHKTGLMALSLILQALEAEKDT